MKIRGASIIFVFAIALYCVYCFASDEGKKASGVVSIKSLNHIKVGEKLPSFGGMDVSKKAITLNSLVRIENTKPAFGAVISFFATWCKPCEKGVEALNELAAQYESKGINFLLISTGENDETVISHLKDKGIRLRTIADEYLTITKRLGVSDKEGKYALPKTIVIDFSGEVIAIYAEEGSKEQFSEAIKKDINRLLISSD